MEFAKEDSVVTHNQKVVGIKAKIYARKFKLQLQLQNKLLPKKYQKNQRK